jgi:hypothetical protein
MRMTFSIHTAIERMESNVHSAAAIALLLATASSRPEQWSALRQSILDAGSDASLGSLPSACEIGLPSDLSLPPLEECGPWINDVARFTCVRLEPNALAL